MKTNAELASSIVDAVLSDLQDRSGIGNAFDDCDTRIMIEIRQSLKKLVETELQNK